jgi:hypothetical protein
MVLCVKWRCTCPSLQWPAASCTVCLTNVETSASCTVCLTDVETRVRVELCA